MPRPLLQLWRFDESEYDRPNQPYVCGRQAEGTPCRIGPDAKSASKEIGEAVRDKDPAVRAAAVRALHAVRPDDADQLLELIRLLEKIEKEQEENLKKLKQKE